MGLQKYILDTNTFIISYKQYYQFETFPSYWNKLSDVTRNSVVLLDSISEELTPKSKEEKNWDEMDTWMHRDFLGEIIKEQQISNIRQKYQEILRYIFDCKFYNEKAFRKWSDLKVADPWIIASAYCNNYIIVTNEIKNGNLNSGSPNGNAKNPDVAEYFGVSTISIF